MRIFQDNAHCENPGCTKFLSIPENEWFLFHVQVSGGELRAALSVDGPLFPSNANQVGKVSWNKVLNPLSIGIGDSMIIGGFSSEEGFAGILG